MDLSFTPEELAFREEARTFVRTAIPESIRAKVAEICEPLGHKVYAIVNYEGFELDRDVQERGLVQPEQRPSGAVVDRQLRIHDAGEQLRSTHVDADRVSDRHGGHYMHRWQTI